MGNADSRRSSFTPPVRPRLLNRHRRGSASSGEDRDEERAAERRAHATDGAEQRRGRWHSCGTVAI